MSNYYSEENFGQQILNLVKEVETLQREDKTLQTDESEGCIRIKQLEKERGQIIAKKENLRQQLNQAKACAAEIKLMEEYAIQNQNEQLEMRRNENLSQKFEDLRPNLEQAQVQLKELAQSGKKSAYIYEQAGLKIQTLLKKGGIKHQKEQPSILTGFLD